MTTRRVSTHLELTVAAEADVVAAVAVADGFERVDETITFELDGRQLESQPIRTGYGGRLHLLRDVEPGPLTVDYVATVEGSKPAVAASDHEWYRFSLPSRYCESDELGPLARGQFGGLSGRTLLDAVSSWVGSNIAYVPGSSRPIDGAVATMLSQSGVCRDFAHLTAALLRANGMPARVASVYAPGLDPMDFHAVAEACLDGQWYVVDPTCLAPRSSLVRIATGADATDTAFLTTLRGEVELDGLEVTAVAQPDLPVDDLDQLIQLS